MIGEGRVEGGGAYVGGDGEMGVGEVMGVALGDLDGVQLVFVVGNIAQTDIIADLGVEALAVGECSVLHDEIKDMEYHLIVACPRGCNSGHRLRWRTQYPHLS